ncbi:rIIB-like protein [Microbacterium phage Cece]|nr:rIIB-like protein [Microbacterium phage Cece]
MVNYLITSNDGVEGVSVIFSDGETRAIGSDNPNYEKVVAGLLEKSLNEDQVLDLIAPFEAMYRTLTQLSERVSRKGNKLLFDGDVAHSVLTDHILKIMNEGSDEAGWKAYIKFWEKLATNPSKQSQEHLFHFIKQNGLTVTPDGDVVFYKGVEKSGLSNRAGYAIVNGVEFDNKHIPNAVGDIIEIPRSMVDDNRGVACSVGLHVGAFSYANTFPSSGNILFTVVVNPRDVVSVPSDHSDRKVRVSRYRIVEENKNRKQYTGTVVELEKPAELVVDGSITAKSAEIAEAAIDTNKIVAGPITIDTMAKKIVYPEGSRIPEYKTLIEALVKADPKVNLKRYKSKKITAGRRDEFEAAANELGFKL